MATFALRLCPLLPLLTTAFTKPLTAIRRCYIPPPRANFGCALLENLTGRDEFGFNSYGQETTAHRRCLQSLRKAPRQASSVIGGICCCCCCAAAAVVVVAAVVVTVAVVEVLVVFVFGAHFLPELCIGPHLRRAATPSCSPWVSVNFGLAPKKR